MTTQHIIAVCGYIPTVAGCAPALVSRLVCSRFSSGAFFYFRVFLRGVGVRPAAHISLSSLAALAGSEISASLASAATDRAQISAYDDMYSEGDPAITITYTANSNYYINSITINNTTVTINASEPANYSSMTGTQYKVWRSSASAVAVTLYACTANVSVVGDVGQTLNYTTGNNITVSSYSRANYSSVQGTLNASVSAGYYPQISYAGSQPITLYNTSGSGSVGGLNFNYTFSNSALSITFTNLPAGVDNIPTISLTATNSVVITVNVNDGSFGGVIVESGGAATAGTGNYALGSTINIYATPAPNCAFLYWIDEDNPDVQISQNPLSVQVTGEKTYTAVFASNLLEDVAVVADYGGSAEIVGEDFENLQPTDEITLVSRVKITGYRFVGWYDGETLLGTSASIRLQYGQIEGKLITARFEYVSNTNMNDSTNTDNDFA